jgi:patatin-like phospholipase/acyl hydrolase
MRGIVELEVLREIQHQIGWQLPVQAFFDLIVGTRCVLRVSSPILTDYHSTGGIIALAFGVKEWSIKKCIDKFRRLCRVAFTRKIMHTIPIFKWIIALKLASKYRTKPLRSTLRSNFGEQPLFGNSGKSRASYHSARIAVTATNESGTKAIILANYSRNNDEHTEQRPGEYEFLRPDRPEQELKVWQAAAATSAAPTYFKPFMHEATKRTYLDGAIYHNNPVRLAQRESKLLWPDVANRDPDIFLSIGTGQHEVFRHHNAQDLGRNDPWR